jgi:FkbM family methyltransferase
MPLTADGRLRPDVSQDNLHYRPQIALDCRLVQELVAERAFASAPLVIGDVGARQGFDRGWDVFGEHCLQIGFEPDAEECARIAAAYDARRDADLPRERIESVALWNEAGRRPLYVMRDANVASCYPPNLAFFRRLPDPSPMHVLKTVEIETTTLDRYHAATGARFDVLKLDVQGGELAVLQGGARQLAGHVLAVITEVEFVELYEGQPLFADVDRFLRGHGFGLFDLDVRRWRRRALPADFDGIRVGQTVWGDALYLRDPIVSPVPAGADARVTLLKLAALAEFFALPDYAMEILAHARATGALTAAEEARGQELLARNRIVARRYRGEFAAARPSA